LIDSPYHRSLMRMASLALFLFAASARADETISESDEACLPPEYPVQAPEGKWKGTFWVEYVPVFTGKVKLAATMHQRWEGEIHFDVIRSERIASLDGVIDGKGSGNMIFTMSLGLGDSYFKQTNSTPKSVEFEIKEKEEAPDWVFRRLDLMAEPDAASDQRVDQTMTSSDTQYSGTTKVDKAGNYSTEGTLKNPDTNLAVNANGTKAQESSSVHGTAARHPTNLSHSGSTESTLPTGGTQQKIVWFRFGIENTTCTTMTGSVDPELLAKRLEPHGVSFTNLTAYWSATFEDVDPEFERKVQELLAKPIPSKPNSADVRDLANEYLALRGREDTGQDYRLCVLKPVLRKIIKGYLALMRHELAYVRWLPASTGFAEINSAMIRAQEAVRFLQLMQAPDCDLERQLIEAMQAKAREAVKEMVKRKHSPQEMLTVNREWAYGILDLGDAAPAFEQAWARDGFPGDPGP
jgi:hypothetical protein